MKASDTVRRDRFTDTPPLQKSWLGGALQSLFWLLVHPSAWRNHIARIDPTLSSSFSLGDLTPAQRNNPTIRRWLGQIIILPLIFYLLLQAMLSLLLHLSLQRIPLTAFQTASENFSTDLPLILLYNSFYILISTLSLASTVSLPSGLLFGLCMALGLPFIHPFQTPIPAIALAAGTAGSSLIYAQKSSLPAPTTKVARDFILIAVLSGLVWGLSYGVVSGLLAPTPIKTEVGLARDVDPITSAWVGALGALLATLFYLTAMHLRHQPHRWAIGVASILGILGGLSYSLGTRATPDHPSIYIWASLGGSVFFSLIFSVFANLGFRLQGPRLAGILGALFTTLSWLPLVNQIFSVSISITPNILVGLVAVALGLSSPWLRPIISYLPLLIFSKVLFEIEKRRPQRSLLHLHPAFWDELQRMPWGGLRDHLLLTMEQFPAIGEQALQYLTGGRQQWAVQATRLELVARSMGNCRNIVSIGNFSQQPHTLVQNFPELQLQAFIEISRDVTMALHNTTEFHSRSILGQTRLRLKQLEDELRNTSHPYAERFAILAHRWLRILNTYLDELSLNQSQQSIPNPYVCGTPLQGDQKMFVGRGNIISRIEQLLLDPRHPPILLYGQRRMGKTSLLLNLGNVLPSQIVPCFVDCQGLSGSSDYAEFFYRMGEQMHHSAKRQTGFLLPALQLKDMENRPFYHINAWLNQAEELLEKQNKFLLIKLDEFELLSSLLNHDEMEARPFLDLLRYTIQHRPRLKLLFACSHDLSELRDWASYLINTQVIKLSYLETGEAHQLIQYPLPGFPLRYDPLALNRMIQLTHGHLQLVQMICYELVTLKNEQPAAQRYLAILDDVETAAARTLETGSFFFADMQNGQIPPSAQPMLIHLARRGANQTLDAETWRNACPQKFEESLQIALRRDIIEAVDGGYRFQIELVRRWFAQAQP